MVHHPEPVVALSVLLLLMKRGRHLCVRGYKYHVLNKAAAVKM